MGGFQGFKGFEGLKGFKAVSGFLRVFKADGAAAKAGLGFRVFRV